MTERPAARPAGKDSHRSPEARPAPQAPAYVLSNAIQPAALTPQPAKRRERHRGRAARQAHQFQFI